MSLFVTSPPSVHGVFAQENPPPSMVQASGTQTAVIVGQFPWGPENALNYPSSMGEFYNTYAPRGMDRTGSAHLSVIRKAWPLLGAVRALHTTGSVPASALLTSTGPVTNATITAKYKGVAGNGIVATVGTASDGDSNHFDLTVTVSGASGATTEIYRNLNVSGTGANVVPNLTNSVLLATFTPGTAGRPDNGNTTMSSGATGATTSTEYVGTPGGGDYGFSLLESDGTIRHVFTDDPGNSLRAAVGAGLLAHVELTTDRIGYYGGNQSQSAAAARTDAATYSSIRMVYTDPWAYVYDDTDGTKRLAPSASWAASVASQLPPSASIAWKADFVKAMLAGIADLETDRGTNRGQNTAAGVTTLIRARQGGYAFEAGKVTSTTAGLTNLTRTRMGQYIAESVTDSWQSYVDGPNVPFYQQDLVNALDAFMGQLKLNKNINPAFLPYVMDYAIPPLASVNTATTLANGDFTVPLDVQIGSNMERIYLSMRYGEGITVSSA